MGKILIAIIGVVYFCIAIEQYFKGNPGTSIAFLGYSIGNIGLFMTAS